MKALKIFILLLAFSTPVFAEDPLPPPSKDTPPPQEEVTHDNEPSKPIEAMSAPPYRTGENKDRYFKFLDYIHEVDWKSTDVQEIMNKIMAPLTAVQGFFFDTYLYQLGFYETNYTKLNYEVRERVARDYPGRENDIDFLIGQIIDERAWDALEMGFLAGGGAEAFIARFGKTAGQLEGKYKSLKAFLGKTALFASVDVLITTQYFLHGYFQIANLLGWTKGDTITRDDARKFFFQMTLYVIYVYGADVGVAMSFQELGAKLLSGMGKKGIKYVTAEELETLGRGFRFVLNMTFSKTRWREFWGLLFRTVGWNEGRKVSFWEAVARNSRNVPMGQSAFAGMLASSLPAKAFYIATQGGISAVQSWIGVKAGLTTLFEFFYPPLTSIPKYGASDFKKVVQSNVLFKILTNVVIANTESIQGVYSRNQRTPLTDVFTDLYQYLYNFPDKSFLTSPFFQELKEKLEKKQSFTLTKEEKEIYFKTNMEANLIVYMLCFYLFAYDGFSIEDSHNLQKIALIEEMLEDREISHNEIQLYMIFQEQFSEQLNYERKLFAKNPEEYQSSRKVSSPETAALHYLLKAHIVPIYETGFSED